MLAELCILSLHYLVYSWSQTTQLTYLLYIGNHAQRGIGHHMYGASIRDVSCDKLHVTFANTQGKPLCLLKHEKVDEYTGIIFDPGFSETLSSVSWVPHRVCLCDPNGKP